MADEITIKAPVCCTGCGLKPGKTKGAFKNEPWMVLNIGVPGVFLMVCPKCNTVMTNSDAVANYKAAVEESKRLIQVPGSPVPGDVIKKLSGG